MDGMNVQKRETIPGVWWMIQHFLYFNLFLSKNPSAVGSTGRMVKTPVASCACVVLDALTKNIPYVSCEFDRMSVQPDNE